MKTARGRFIFVPARRCPTSSWASWSRHVVARSKAARSKSDKPRNINGSPKCRSDERSFDGEGVRSTKASRIQLGIGRNTMNKLTPCLWFDGKAEEAANFWTGIFPDSHVDKVSRSAAENPSGPEGAVLTVEFTLSGSPFVGLNGGADFTFNEAISFQIDCADQAEVDRYWDELTAGGGEPGPCGWLKDRFGVSWQVIPSRLPQLLAGSDPDGARRAMQAMLQMGKLDVAALEAAYAGTAQQ